MTVDERFDQKSLTQAQAGSQRAFRSLVAPYEAELKRHCYRMTGSLDDADDIVQETLFRAWKGLGAYTNYGSFRAWLYRIATNQTLDLLKSASRRREMVNTAGEPVWLQPFPSGLVDQTGEAAVEVERVSLAFIVALQNLPGRQRSALLLCDVLGFTSAEAAEILDTSKTAINSLLQRARSRTMPVEEFDLADTSQVEQRELVQRFTDAWRNGDAKAMVALLDESSHLTMPPHEMEFIGAEAIVDLLLDEVRFAAHDDVVFREITANGECGIATYTRNRDGALADRHCLMFFGSATTRAGKITGFTEDRIFELLGLPLMVDATQP